MIKQLLNSVIAKYHDLPESRRSIICLSPRLRQIIFMLATDKSRYFAQPRPIIVNYLILQRPWQTRTHCSRFPVCPRAQHLLRTQILCPGHKKMFLILLSNILCPQQMFPSLGSPRNIMGNNVSLFTMALILRFTDRIERMEKKTNYIMKFV